MSNITFGEGSEAHYSVFRGIAEREYTVDIVLKPGIIGLPSERVVVLLADDEGIAVCETTDDGAPIRNGTWHIGYDEIDTLTIL